jgi:hypothetical protein
LNGLEYYFSDKASVGGLFAKKGKRSHATCAGYGGGNPVDVAGIMRVSPSGKALASQENTVFAPCFFISPA